MSAANLCPILQENQWSNDAQFLAGGLMWFYAAGTTTPLTAYTDGTALTAWTNPIQLDARGETGGEIWLQAGQYYKIVLEGPPLFGQTHGVTISTYDQISGINDATLLLLSGDWETFGGTPTFLTSSSFSVSGDNRAILQVNRRLKLSCASGLQYGTISVASFTGSVTNITLRMDAGNALDSGLSSFQYGLIQTNPSSIPVAVQTGTTTAGSNHEIYIDYSSPTLNLGVDSTNFGSQWPISAALSSPSGMIINYAGATAPTGYLECNGSAISRTIYATLFNAIGTTYGTGDGSTTFNIPDLRGYFVRGWSDGSSIDSGRTLGSTQTASNAPHTHGINDPGHAHGVNDPGHAHGISPGVASWNSAAGGGGGGNVQTQSNVTATQGAGTGISIQGAGTGISTQSSGAEARPINIALMYCIKT